ncbi:MAG: molybdopterin-dependent oxidoreductase [Maricaulaceae bacterium]
MSVKTHQRVCNFCEAMCGVTVSYDPEAKGEKQIAVKPDKLDPFSRGSMCPKAPVLGPLHFDKNRLKYPVKRVGDKWEKISWPEAYDMVEREFKALRDKYGKDAIATYLGNPIVHNLGMLLFVKTLTKAIGSKNVFSATSMDQLPHHFAAHFMFGHEFRIPVPDIDRTDHMIIMGANPLASNGSIMTSAGVTERLKHIQSRGGKFVVIDPRHTETAKIASEHHFIRPATDVYFLLSFLHILYRDNHKKLGRLEVHIKGEEQLKDLVAPFTPEAVAPITGIEASEIERMVAEFMAQDKAVIYGRMGLSTQAHGGLNNWLLNTINIISGNFDQDGGMMFPSPAIELARGKTQPKASGRWKSQSRGLDEFYGEYPVSGMVDEFSSKAETKVRGFLTICGNPVLSTPSGSRLEAELPDVEFMVSIDNYINETTRHANLILPTPTGLEIDHYDLIFHTISVSNNVKFSEALFPVEKDRPYDWQVLKELIKRFSPKGLDLFTRFATPRRVINWGLMLGPYGKLSHPKRWVSGLTLKKVIASKHGLRMGPMQPRVPDGLITNDRKINIAPENYVARLKQVTATEFVELANIAAAQKSDELRLIGRRHVNTNNSWMHQYRKLSKSKMVRCTAMINPQDADRLKIGDGDDISVSTRIGEIKLPAEVTDNMMAGTICIPHGFGHHRKGTRVPVASEKPGVSVNDITDHMLIDPLTGNAAFSGQMVKVKALIERQEITQVTAKPVSILYGSRTGNAEALASDAARKVEAHDMAANVYAMEDIDIEQLSSMERVLIICSTYGEGDMPDNAQALWDEVLVAQKGALSGVNYSVLALGDTAYETYCQAGKNWDAQLEKLGGVRVSPRIDCDVDYTENFENWVEVALPLITKAGDQDRRVTQASRANMRRLKGTSRDNPLEFTLSEKRALTGEGSSKETYHYTLSHDDIDGLYEAGGILNIFAKNDPALVDLFAKMIGIKLSAKKHAALAQKLIDGLDLRTPSQDLLDMAGLKAVDLNGLDVIDVIKMIANKKGNISKMRGQIIECLRPLMPRAYSIASSSKTSSDKVDLCVATVRYDLGARAYGGVASAYLQDQLEVGDKVRGYFVSNKAFALPSDSTQPVIMIGPGTGLAPFRGFLQEHAHRGYTSPTWLFFGDRNMDTDFLYEDEIEGYLSAGTLSKLDLAFSRDHAEKVYVQDRMRENAAELFDYLEKDAAVFICGDAKHMAHDVDLALREIIQTQGNMTKTQADQYLELMKQDKRYVRDVY